MPVKKNTDQTPWQLALPVLRKLSAELDAGIAALARRDLKTFEKHVAAQQELCDVLLETGIVFSPVTTRIEREALQSLDHQKRVYSALLRRERTFSQVLLTLHQSRNGYSPDGMLASTGSTWSSEA
jgi:hypothetical protein